MGLSQSVRSRRTGWADMLVMLGLVGLIPPASAQISIAPQSGQPGDTVSVPVIFSDAGAPISAVQFDLSYPAGVSLSAAPGNALQTASKTIYSADITSSQRRFLMVGVNQNIISAGTLINLTVTIASTATSGSFGLKFGNVVAAAPDGTGVPLPAQDGTITILGGSPGPSSFTVLNAASLAAGPVAPGEIVTLFGKGLRPAAGSLSDSAVLVNGIPAPLLYAQTTQINAVIPYEVSGQTATVAVLYQNQMLVQVTVQVAPTAPGIFSIDSSGIGQGVIFNQDQTPNSFSWPAARGSTVTILATGAGQMTPAVPDGQIISGAVVPIPLLPVSAMIGGIRVPVSYAGSVPGLIAGVLQATCQVPAAVEVGPDIPVRLIMGGTLSQIGLTMAIQ